MRTGGGTLEIERSGPASRTGARPALRMLVVEDDATTATDLVRGLRNEGFEVELATASRDAARFMASRTYDAIVVDLMLAEEGGFEVLARARSRLLAPTFALSSRTELGDRLHAFELGAADFVPKPFWIEELVARIRARLRVPSEASKRTVRWSACELDLDARTAAVDGRPIALTPTEFAVLAFLVERRGRAVSRSALASQALASIDRPDSRTVDSHVARLRRKLGTGADAIVTVWGTGYRFDAAAGIRTLTAAPGTPPRELPSTRLLRSRLEPDSEPPAVRSAREDDFPAIATAIQHWWTAEGLDSAEDRRERAALLPPLWLQHFASTSLVAEGARRIDGFLVGFHSADRPGEAYVHFVGVSPSRRHAGVGRALYQRFFDACRAGGRTRIRCVTSPRNTESIAFHAAMGFRVERTTDLEGQGRRIALLRDL